MTLRLYVSGWARTTDTLGYSLVAWCVGTAVLSLTSIPGVQVRIFNEFFLTLPSAHLIYGLSISGDKSRLYRILTHRHMVTVGGISYAAYLLQFPVWNYAGLIETGTFKNLYNPCDRYDPDHAESWFDCMAIRRPWPDVLVIWNVWLVFAVAYVVNRFYERPVVAWLSKKLL